MLVLLSWDGSLGLDVWFLPSLINVTRVGVGGQLYLPLDTIVTSLGKSRASHCQNTLGEGFFFFPARIPKML